MQLPVNRLGRCLVQAPRVRIRRSAGEDLRRSGLLGDLRDDRDTVAAPQAQRAASLVQRVLQCGQTVMQPPAGGAPQRPGSSRLVVEDEHRKDRTAGLDRGVQRGVVLEAQVVAEPQENRKV